MKKTFTLLAAALIGFTLFLNSCKKEEDPEPTTSGSTDPRDRFVATWFNSENSIDFGPSTYNVTVSDSSNSSYIMFGFLYGFNKRIYATVGGNSFNIPSQLVSGNNVTGSGTLTNSNQINMTYIVQTTGTHWDTVTCVLTK
jgi:hypothetical protein